jgi:acyl-homoserine-lactone acylase
MAIRTIIIGAVCLLCAGPAAGQPPLDPHALWTQATVYRDEWGVPHVTADNPTALAFAFGYAQAEDHLGPMLKAYRIARGAAAEVFGPDYADSDAFALSMGHAALAEEALGEVDPITLHLCRGFALGVNAWIVDFPDRVPPWAEGIRPEDVLTLWHCYIMSFAPYDLPGDSPGPRPATTGNAWAIAPQHTTTGETILVINPHADYTGPFQWYEAHLTLPDMNMSGATLFGLPVILQGHNGVLGWALTPNQPDFADFYTDIQSPTRARGRREKKLEDRLEAFLESSELAVMANAKPYYVQGPAGIEERRAPFLITPQGPVIDKYRGRYCMYRIGGYGDFGGLRQLFDMARATHLDQFQGALLMHQLPCFHVVYADREGNLFYTYNAKVAMRPAPDLRPAIVRSIGNMPMPANMPDPRVNWNAPLPSGDSDYEWGELIPPDAMPAITNPASGWIQACGNPPWTVTADFDLHPNDWPDWLARDTDSFRARRVRHLLGMGQRSFQDVQAMLYDTLVPGAVATVPRLLQTVNANPAWLAQAHPDVPGAIARLRDWNYLAGLDSPGMTVFHVWWASLHAVPPAGWRRSDIAPAFGVNPPELQEASLQALEQTARLMRNEFRSLDVPWGEVHVCKRGDREVPLPGAASGDPVFVASDQVFQDHRWLATTGYGFAMAVRFGEMTEALSVAPFGASENPASPHFDDQLTLMTGRRLKFARFDREEALRYAETAHGRVLRLLPLGMEAVFTVRAQAPVTARIATSPKSQAPIPYGLATFTMYAGIECAPATEPCSIDMEIYVDPEICPQEHLGHLAVHAYDVAQQAWLPLEPQQLDPERRVLTAHDDTLRLYAVLGPSRFRPRPTAEQLAQLQEDSGSAEEEEEPGTAETGNTDGDFPQETAQESEVAVPAAPAPEPAQEEAEEPATAIGWGRHLVLDLPGAPGNVTVTAPTTVGARVSVLNEAPGPPPPGLVPFSRYVSLECSAGEADITVALSIGIEPGVCDDADLEQLVLYAFDTEAGWAALPGQKLEKAARTVNADDSRTRTYAILGPGEFLKSPSGASGGAN